MDYQIKKLEKSTRDFISSREKTIYKEFTYPKLNEYIPKDLDLVSICESEKET